MRMKLDTKSYRLAGGEKLAKILLITGISGLVISGVGLMLDPQQFSFSYLTAFIFWLTLGLGGFFFTMIHHLTGAVWSLVLRRISETAMALMPVMALLFLPVVTGLLQDQIYVWSSQSDAIIEVKSGYLNIPFFLIRSALYFLIWIILGRWLYNTSLQQDDRFDAARLTRMRRISGPGMALFALSITFAAFDWIMSLDPHWYSTIFGLYIFSGSLLAIYTFLILFTSFLRHQHVLTDTIHVEHYHDLGKFLFGFTIFWGYIAFSQYFLIWYANIPEETIWYRHRWEGSWKILTMTLVFGHFLLPFIALMPRFVKRSIKLLRSIAIWILAMHYIDLYWIIMPNLHHHGLHYSWMDVTSLIGIGGIFLWFFWRLFKRQAVVPLKNPDLKKSIDFMA
jgi:hypothetical protein